MCFFLGGGGVDLRMNEEDYNMLLNLIMYFILVGEKRWELSSGFRLPHRPHKNPCFGRGKNETRVAKSRKRAKNKGTVRSEAIRELKREKSLKRKYRSIHFPPQLVQDFVHQYDVPTFVDTSQLRIGFALCLASCAKKTPEARAMTLDVQSVQPLGAFMSPKTPKTIIPEWWKQGLSIRSIGSDNFIKAMLILQRMCFLGTEIWIRIGNGPDRSWESLRRTKRDVWRLSYFSFKAKGWRLISWEFKGAPPMPPPQERRPC